MPAAALVLYMLSGLRKGRRRFLCQLPLWFYILKKMGQTRRKALLFRRWLEKQIKIMEENAAPVEHQWELSKENAQPLKHGRDARKLNKIFAEVRDPVRDAKLKEEQQ
jgi:hypothetical protein